MDDVSFETVKGVSFGVYTSEEIKKLSVLEVINTEILDCLDHPAPNGLHDLRLGPNERDDFCETCNLNYFTCPGHIGHIALPIPVYNPAFFTHLYQLLRGSCFHCHRLLVPQNRLYLAMYQLQALDYGLVSLVQELAEILTDTTQESFSDADYVIQIQTKLKKKFEAAVAGMSTDDKKHHVKSVVECRRRIVKDFTQNSMNVSGKCPHCKMPKRKITRHNLRIVYVVTKRSMQVQSSSQTNGNDEDVLSSTLSSNEILPAEAKKHLSKLWENDKSFLQHLFKILHLEENQEEQTINMFFMDVLIIPPTRFRRLNVMKGKKFADPQTVTLNEILKDCYAIQNLQKFVKQLPLDQAEKDMVTKLTGKTNGEKYSYLYQQLQRHVNEIFDSSVNKERNKFGKGIKQVLEKKEGLFRMNMMGKRVNYSARSVISPDPYINVNEIGVPMVFAKKLTFPEPVSTWNFEKLRYAVMNGPNVHPGAVLVEYEDGRIVRLPDDIARRHAIANTLLTPQSSAAAKVIGGVKIVHRHLKNGDMLLLNRQPTLHKPSIMAHKARVLPGEKTLRLHYANCKSYNADFDGDEMNIHFPQSFLGQAECRHVVSVSHQYLVPKDGTPLSGLIQDHIIAGTLLTLRGSFFTEDFYHQLLYSALSFTPKSLKLLPPSIIKPVQLWSGKQIVSSIIINLIPEGKNPPTVEGRSKVPSKNWKNAPVKKLAAGGTPLEGDNMSESEVIIRDGELLCGIIDKAQVGPTPYSLIHVCYELYGGEISSTILTSLARLFTHYLQYYSGFTLGIEDIIVMREADSQRKEALEKAAVKGLVATSKALEVTHPEDTEKLLKKYKDTHFNRDDFAIKVLDMEMKKVTQELNNDIKNACMPTGLIKKFPVNNLQLMIESGAKGSMVNAMQISCLLGQIELEGRRMPLMLNGSTLPSFPTYDTSPAAGGFVAGRFLTGVNPQEYFFHCMAGREGLIDTAVKTSRSGYLQRCLIKHLEGITVNYDQTVRDSDGTVIQFLYGEDGLDILKLQMLKEKSLRLLAQNYDAAINEEDMQRLINTVEDDLPHLKKKIKKWKKKHSKHVGRRPLIDCLQGDIGAMNVHQRLELLNMQKCEIDAAKLKKYERSNRKCPDPVNSQYRPDLVFGSVSEQMDQIISDYMNKNLSTFSAAPENKMESEKFQDLCYYRAQKALAHPGETVGLLAAQSIGEPSTQMTLNTFHFAGKGEMNVTLGIPRIREILMTASANIATPTMDLPLLDHPDIEQKAEKLKLKLNPVPLKEVLESIKVKECIMIHTHSDINYRKYVIRLNFLKHSEYKGFINATPSKILYYIENVFVKKLIEAIKKKKRQTSTSKLVDYMKDVTSKFNTGKMKDEELDSGPSELPESRGPKDDNDDSSGAEDEGDEDATSAKSKKRHDQEQEYEDPEEDEMPPESDLDETEKEEDIEIKKEIQTDDEEKQEEDFSMPLNITKKRFKGAISEEEKSHRRNAVQCIHSWVSGYDFDAEKERWCEISLQIQLDQNKIDMKTLLEDEVAKNFVYSIPHIKEALLVKNTDPNATCKLMIKTNGVNFLEVFNHVDILDINKAYSNNIHAIAEIYGIEAAARAIKRETVNVFKPYGIVVDPRHLSLISDYMTSSGYYRPCNRIGIEGNASPLQQMTFETTKNFMVDAMFMGVEDRLKSPSANIIFGQPYEAGTGCFGLKAKPGKYA